MLLRSGRRRHANAPIVGVHCAMGAAWLLCVASLTAASEQSLETTVESTAIAELMRGFDAPRLGAAEVARGDYLLDAAPFTARVGRTSRGEIALDNGLIRRTWTLEPHCACIELFNRMTGNAMVRAVRPEARLVIDGRPYAIGGLAGQENLAYLDENQVGSLRAPQEALQLVGVSVGEPVERLAWGRRRRASPDANWPPAGVALRFDYEPTDTPAGATAPPASRFRVSVHYEMYDGAPLMSKRLVVTNLGDDAFTIDKFTAEELAVVEHGNWVETRAGVSIPEPDCLHVETDFAFGGFNSENANRHCVHWRTDSDYATQVNYERQTPCLLVAEPTNGPAQRVAPGKTWESFTVFELVHDDGGRERRGLALRRMYRLMAPWVTENPLTHHLLSNDPVRIRQAIDEAAEVGFEALILSFGSGFDMERRDSEFLESCRELADYAHERQIELGCYSLFSSRDVGAEHMIVSPPGQRPTHGQCPAVTSEWGRRWIETIRDFYGRTRFDQFENDGPYPGDVDVTPRLPDQAGELDSRWAQWRATTGLYRDLRSQGVYINAPDFYYLSGSNKCGMGYRETNWSLPRLQQVIHTRQNIYDGTWTKTPSMGWMFCPLTEYHGGGAAATIEPLSQHREHYRRMMLSNLGMGVQAHYRGPRLYDGPDVRAMVRAATDWFKCYRDILESDVVHGRRADGVRLDWSLHVNPRLEQRGMLCVYNPTSRAIRETLHVGLYYTGLSGVVELGRQDRDFASVEMDSRGFVDIAVEAPAGEMQWYVVRERRGDRDGN
ncbi:MAG: hypothetical protein KDA61_14390 [Planctomycetales bacterium]|nr:hypothetical protein [Planctomycetales bacterium]